MTPSAAMINLPDDAAYWRSLSLNLDIPPIRKLDGLEVQDEECRLPRSSKSGFELGLVTEFSYPVTQVSWRPSVVKHIWTWAFFPALALVAQASCSVKCGVYLSVDIPTVCQVRAVSDFV